ncbi:MAG: LLM class F420-dependent oxidoreductase [Acetobacteraceae bacterium]
MQYGFGLPVRGELANYDGIVAMAQHGERLGFTSTTIADHIVFPVASESKYPYDATGRHPSTGDAIEPLSLMAFVAGKTSTLRLVTSVLILPHRNPVLTAKMIATIDVLSQGRVTLGIGVGWLREEFAALGAPDFDRRGAISDEYVAIFKKLWSPGPVEHHGDWYDFAPLRCEPLPVQKPHPPIWVGGHSRHAIRRTARLADGWHPLGTVDTAELRPPEFSAMLDDLKRQTEAQGRDYRDITIAFVARLRETPQPIAANDRMPFSGSAEQIAGDVLVYRDLGVTHLSFDFRRPSLTETLDRMSWFAQTVMPVTGDPAV